MAELTSSVIHQTLHGYADGHTLLAASCELTAIEKKALLLLSDLSGQAGTKGFDSYLTGYPLPGKRYYALARTWDAPEMPRPGCVWTQTLLLALPLLTRIRHLSELNKLFERPQLGLTSSYSIVIPAHIFTNTISSSLYSVKPRFYAIAYYLYSKTRGTVVIPAESSAEYEEDILSIWSQQWPRLRRSFSFCTGSLSIRELDNKLFELQVVPNSYGSRLSRQQVDNVNVVDLSTKTKATNWFKAYESIQPQWLQEFMYEYGSDIIGKRSKFAPLCLAYTILYSEQEYSISFENLLSFFKQYFSSASEAKRLKLDLISKIIENTPDGEYHFIKTLLTSVNTDVIPAQEWNFSEQIIRLWSEKRISSDNVINLLEELDTSRLSDSQRVQLLTNLPAETWFDVKWVTDALLAEVIITQPQLLINLLSEGKIDKEKAEIILEDLDINRISESQKIQLLGELPIEIWIDVTWVTDSLLTEVIITQPYLLEQPVFWQGKISNQRIGLDVFTKDNTNLVHVSRVVDAMLDAQNDKWIDNLSSVFESLLLFAALEWWIRKPNALLLQKWENLVWVYRDEYLMWLAKNQYYTKQTIGLMLQIFVAKEFNANGVGKKDAKVLLTQLVKTQLSDQRNHAMAIWLAKGLNNAHPAAKEITVILFQPIYTMVEQDKLASHSWAVLDPRFERPIEIFNLAKITKAIKNYLFEEKPQSDDWDKCGQLRQKIIQSCIVFQWPSEILCRAVTNRGTFKEITRYALGFESGKALFVKVSRFIKESKTYKNPDYTKIIESEYEKTKKGKKQRK
jgi:hypothetical protein